jgi:hypothetical protein
MTGWLIAALLAGFIAGVVVGVVLVRRYLPGIAAPAPKPVVHQPPEPEDVAQAEIQDAMKERIVQDLVEREGLSLDDASAVAEEVWTKFHRLGADGHW